MRHDERRPVHGGQHLRHRERLAGAGDAEQHLVRVAAIETLDKLGNGANLIAAHLEIADEGESIVRQMASMISD